MLRFELRDFADRFASADIEAACVAGGGVECAEDEFGALDIDCAADEGADDLPEGGLDGWTPNESGGVDAGGGVANRTEHSLVEVAALLSAKSWGAAADSGDLDMSAEVN